MPACGLSAEKVSGPPSAGNPNDPRVAARVRQGPYGGRSPPSWPDGPGLPDPEEVIHRDLECHRDSPQRAGTRQSRFSTFDLIESRPRNLLAGQLIGAPPLAVAEVSTR